ncbi:MAG: DegV family protein [Clostridia bacterium]|nr:DegV family protein [Clostridia bacterium]
MSDFVLMTDSACDISRDLLSEWGVSYVSLSFRFQKDDKEYYDGDMDPERFYDNIRKGNYAKTSAVNVSSVKDKIEEFLKYGKDVLYIAFSSGLSMTYNSGVSAADELRAEYPDRKIVVIDSLAASAGEGLLVYLASLEKKNGVSIDELADFVIKKREHLCHWFTVDDLKYLRAGGRVSATTAVIGGMLGVKPVLHVDDNGHLIKKFTVRGRIKSIWALGDKFGEFALNKRVFISHGDCLEDAKLLKEYVESKYDAKVEVITYVGSVIGAHSGPGTLSIFFEGTHK